MAKTAIIIQARMGSTRLLEKVLAEIHGKTMLEILINRLKRSKLADIIIIATTTNKADDRIAAAAKKLRTGLYRGSEDNVLSRFIEAAESVNANIIVRVTADNPLTDPELIDLLIKTHVKNKADYTYAENTALGTGAEVVNFNALKSAESKANKSEQEHVTLFIRARPDLFKIIAAKTNLTKKDVEGIRLTVDTKEDFALIKKLEKQLGPIETLEVGKVIKFLKKNPSVMKINQNVIQIVPSELRKPEISVIMRTYNSEKYLEKTLLSAIKQTLPQAQYEIIIVDDCSTDTTLKIAEKYKDSSRNIRLLKNKHLGAIKALNDGIKNAKGQYIILLDSDDIFVPETLEIMLQKIKETVKEDAENKADFVCSDYYEKDEETGSTKIVSLKENIFNSVAGGILFKKKIIEEEGGYDEKLIFPEYDLLIKLIKSGCVYAHIPKPLFTYLRHKESITANKSIVEKGFEQLREKYGEIKGLRKY